MLYRKIIYVYSGNPTKHVSALCGKTESFSLKLDSTNSNHRPLKGQTKRNNIIKNWSILAWKDLVQIVKTMLFSADQTGGV
jgi:hypothetical protein